MILINDIPVCDLMTSDLHMHTTFCDGRNTPEEMVRSALDKGFTCIGFSGHSPVSFDPAGGMPYENTVPYRQTIEALKTAYKDRIRIYCGIEQDYYSETGTSQYDYVIGSVHYIDACGHKIAVDDTPEVFKEGVMKYFGGDFYTACEYYFRNVSYVVSKTGADIIGHFDLISKFNEKDHMFDEHNPRYIEAWKKAADSLLLTGRPFEINTGAISRGWRSEAYPSPDIIRYIKERGGEFILSSDSHNAENIGYGFRDAAKLIS